MYQKSFTLKYELPNAYFPRHCTHDTLSVECCATWLRSMPTSWMETSNGILENITVNGFYKNWPPTETETLKLKTTISGSAVAMQLRIL